METPEAVGRTAQRRSHEPSPHSRDRSPETKRFNRRSPQPAARSPQPAARSPQPAARSPQPAARSPQPAARSPQPAARSPQPAARSPQPAARSPQPATPELARWRPWRGWPWRHGRWTTSTACSSPWRAASLERRRSAPLWHQPAKRPSRPYDVASVQAFHDTCPRTCPRPGAGSTDAGPCPGEHRVHLGGPHG
ncbi:hypothetical protein [Streptomyces dangxiongensis]|uniref:hypothetical protein n=1 Tax=Streptomyces dangxiongensis TaxID=1442032 RepID=UPI001969ADBC